MMQADNVRLTAANERTMTTTGTLRAPSGGVMDDSGTWIEGEPTSLTVSARVQEDTRNNAAEYTVAEGYEGQTKYQITFPKGTVVSSDCTYDCALGLFQVIGVRSGQTWEVGTRVLAVKRGN